MHWCTVYKGDINELISSLIRWWQVLTQSCSFIHCVRLFCAFSYNVVIMYWIDLSCVVIYWIVTGGIENNIYCFSLPKSPLVYTKYETSIVMPNCWILPHWSLRRILWGIRSETDLLLRTCLWVGDGAGGRGEKIRCQAWDHKTQCECSRAWHGLRWQLAAANLLLKWFTRLFVFNISTS